MQTNPMEDLGFLWTACRMTDPDSCTDLVHHGPTHCLVEFLQKLVDTGKAAGKLYVVFHMIPFLMRLRKIKSPLELLSLLAKGIKEYGRSVLFMSFLVGLLRGFLCVNWNFKPKPLMRPWLAFISYMSPLSAVSILFEDRSRRGQVVYHVCAKALRSSYLVVKRVWGVEYSNQAELMHMGIMALLYYVYNHRPSTLKYRNIFELILGDS